MDWVAAFVWNGWQLCRGISGSFGLEYATERETLPIFSGVTEARNEDSTYPDLDEVKGQTHAKRALEIAAAGGHSLLMIGPPGTGKSMLAARFPGILPPMTEVEALESASI